MKKKSWKCSSELIENNMLSFKLLKKIKVIKLKRTFFQTLLRELSTRQKSMNSLVKSANEQGDDSLKAQLKDLVSHWDAVNELAEKRKTRLESALNDAKHLDESLKGKFLKP